MKAVALCILVPALIANCCAKPTFDVLANIFHDLVHDPNQPHDHGDPYAPVGPYVQNGGSGGGVYNRPYIQQQPGSGYQQQYPNNRPYTQQGVVGYYPNSQYQGSYANGGHGQGGGYGQQQVYTDQGYYKGPPYRGQNTNGYNSNVNYGYQSPPQNGYRNRGY